MELPLDCAFPDNEISQSIIGVQHLPLLDAVCFATAGGDVNLFDTTTKQVPLKCFLYPLTSKVEVILFRKTMFFFSLSVLEVLMVA